MARKETERPLRIVLYEPSGRGGICHYTYQLAEALAQRECRVTVLTATNYELDRLPRRFRTVFLFKPSRVKRLLARGMRLGRNLTATESGSDDARPSRSASSILRVLRSVRIRLLFASLALRILWYRADVVHFQSVSRGRDVVLVRLLTRLGLRTVYTAHDLVPHDSGSPFEREALAEVYRLVDRVIVHAQSNRLEMVSEFRVDPRKIVIVPHGSYEFLMPEGRISRDDARARLGFPAAGRIVLFFGLIKRYKGLEFLVEAFRRIEKRLSDAKLAIVGGLFPEADGYALYRRLLEDVSRKVNVICVPDYVPLERVGLYFCAADVVALPYTKTYQSGVLHAAYAAGRPVVVTDTGGLSEVVEEGGTGFVVPPRDSDALADAILRLLEDPSRAAAMGERAYHLGRTIFSWERIADQTARLYRALVKAGSFRRANGRLDERAVSGLETSPGGPRDAR